MTTPTVRELNIRLKGLEARTDDNERAIETLTSKVNTLIVGDAITRKALALLLEAQGKSMPALTDELFDTRPSRRS